MKPASTLYPLVARRGGLTLVRGPELAEWRKLIKRAPPWRAAAVALVKRNDGSIEEWPVWEWKWLESGFTALATVPGKPGDPFPAEPRLSPHLLDTGSAFALLVPRSGHVMDSHGEWFRSREAWIESVKGTAP